MSGIWSLIAALGERLSRCVPARLALEVGRRIVCSGDFSTKDTGALTFKWRSPIGVAQTLFENKL